MSEKVTQLQRTGVFPHQVDLILHIVLEMQRRGNITPSCYQVSETIVGACKHYGIDAEAIMVDTYVWNCDADRLITNPKLKAQWEGDRSKMGFKKKAQMLRIKPKFVGIHHGQEVEGEGYNGHVIAKIGNVYVDATAFQFTRADHGLIMPDCMLIKDEQFVNNDLSHMDLVEDVSKNDLSFKVAFPNKDGHVLYCLRPDVEKDYMDHREHTRDNIAWSIQHVIDSVGASDRHNEEMERRDQV